MVVVLATCGSDYASVWDSTSLSSGASYAEILDVQVRRLSCEFVSLWSRGRGEGGWKG